MGFVLGLAIGSALTFGVLWLMAQGVGSSQKWW